MPAYRLYGYLTQNVQRYPVVTSLAIPSDAGLCCCASGSGACCCPSRCQGPQIAERLVVGMYCIPSLLVIRILTLHVARRRRHQRCNNPCVVSALKNYFGAAASRYEEDVFWMAIHLEVPFLVYQAEESQLHEYLANKHSNVAREASAFLQFISEYYDCLPEVYLTFMSFTVPARF